MTLGRGHRNCGGNEDIWIIYGWYMDNIWIIYGRCMVNTDQALEIKIQCDWPMNHYRNIGFLYGILWNLASTSVWIASTVRCMVDVFWKPYLGIRGKVRIYIYIYIYLHVTDMMHRQMYHPCTELCGLNHEITEQCSTLLSHSIESWFVSRFSRSCVWRNLHYMKGSCSSTN